MITLPVIFFKFWFLEAPESLISFFTSFNKSLLELFSLPLLIKTFFKPWKNEYRKGLIGFSRGMGMFIKSFVILADLVILVFFIFLEAIVFSAFILWPFATLILLKPN